MKLHPIQFVMAEAPIDPFDPDGDQMYLVIARVPKLLDENGVPVMVRMTKAYSDPAEALAHLDPQRAERIVDGKLVVLVDATTDALLRVNARVRRPADLTKPVRTMHQLTPGE